MKPIILSSGELFSWTKDTYSLYASDAIAGKRRRLYVNHQYNFKVVYGEDVIYQGNNLQVAVDQFNYIAIY